MFNLVAVIAGWVALLVVGVAVNVVNMGVFTVNVAVIVTVYMVVHRDTFDALIVAFALCLLAATLSGGARGATLLGILPAIGATWWAKGNIDTEKLWRSAGWCVVASLLADFGFAAVMMLFESGKGWMNMFWHVAPASALLTGFAALPMHGFLHMLDPILSGTHEEGTWLK